MKEEKWLKVYAILMRIADKKFQEQVWGSGNNENYNSIIISCLEGLEMLGDVNFFGLIEEEWAKSTFSKDLNVSLVDLADEIKNFNDYSLPINQLLSNAQWNKITALSQEVINRMNDELSIDPNYAPSY